jgi:hypothetical protein
MRFAPGLALLLLGAAATPPAGAQFRLERHGAALGDPAPSAPPPAAVDPAPLLARRSIAEPASLPFPRRDAEYFRALFASRTNTFFVVGARFVDASAFEARGGAVRVVPDARAWSRFTLGRHLGGGVYLAGPSLALAVGDPGYPEGAVVAGLAVADGHLDHSPAPNLRRRLERKILHAPRPATFDEFAEALQAGQPIRGVGKRAVICVVCDGKRHVPSTHRTMSGKVRAIDQACPTCRAAGFVTVEGACLFTLR